MYSKVFMTVTSNQAKTADVYEMKLQGNTEFITAPGQFVNIKIDGCYLRRPISVCDYDVNSLTLVYKAVGKGTDILSKTQLGTTLDVLTGLGNGYDLTKSGASPLLIGGGVGVPPMFNLAKKLIADSREVTVILGFNTAKGIFYVNEFLKLGAKVIVTTVDGSYGMKGFVTDVMDMIDYTFFYTCGPLPMLKSVYNKSVTDGQFSFEERMGCGFGVCNGCTCATKYGSKKICVDGPVMNKEEIIW